MPLTKYESGQLTTTPHKAKKNFPKIREAYKLPVVSDISTSFITATLIDLDSSGRKGIKIANSGVLPADGNDVTYFLGYAWWQGTEPNSKNWTFQKLVLKSGNFEIILEAIPSSNYLFFLQLINAGKTIAFPSISIITPEDQTIISINSIFTDDILSRNEKPFFKLLYDTILSEQVSMNNAASYWVPAIDIEKNAYNTSVTNLTTHLTSLSPSYLDFTQDTSLGVNGGATLRGLYNIVYNKKQILQAKIDQFVKNNIDDIYSDDKLTPSDKIKVKADYDVIKIEQTRPITGLDALASAYSVSSVTYDNAITSLETYLATLSGWNNNNKDWISYGTTQDLGTGGGLTLRTKFADILRAMVDLKKAIDDARDASITGGIETGIPSVNGLPALPHSAYSAGKIVWDLVTNRLYRSTGNTWEAHADAIIGQLTAGQTAANTINTSSLNFDTLTSGSYTESSGTPTNGFKFDSYNNILKLGPNGLNINGYLFNRDTLRVNRIRNGNFLAFCEGWCWKAIGGEFINPSQINNGMGSSLFKFNNFGVANGNMAGVESSQTEQANYLELLQSVQIPPKVNISTVNLSLTWHCQHYHIPANDNQKGLITVQKSNNDGTYTTIYSEYSTASQGNQTKSINIDVSSYFNSNNPTDISFKILLKSVWGSSASNLNNYIYVGDIKLVI